MADSSRADRGRIRSLVKTPAAKSAWVNPDRPRSVSNATKRLKKQ